MLVKELDVKNVTNSSVCQSTLLIKFQESSFSGDTSLDSRPLQASYVFARFVLLSKWLNIFTVLELHPRCSLVVGMVISVATKPVNYIATHMSTINKKAGSFLTEQPHPKP